MKHQSATPSGLSKFIRKAGEFVLVSLRERMDSIPLELHEKKVRLVHFCFSVGVALFAGCMAVVFASLTILCVFWQSARLAALGGLTFVYTAVLLCMAHRIRRQMGDQPLTLSASIKERLKDK
jgi:uncharacterized membrane protein YqjE